MPSLSERMPSPRPLPSSGSFLGPKTRRAMKKMTNRCIGWKRPSNIQTSQTGYFRRLNVNGGAPFPSNEVPGRSLVHIIDPASLMEPRVGSVRSSRTGLRSYYLRDLPRITDAVYVFKEISAGPPHCPRSRREVFSPGFSGFVLAGCSRAVVWGDVSGVAGRSHAIGGVAHGWDFQHPAGAAGGGTGCVICRVGCGRKTAARGGRRFGARQSAAYGPSRAGFEGRVPASFVQGSRTGAGEEVRRSRRSAHESSAFGFRKFQLALRPWPDAARTGAV